MSALPAARPDVADVKARVDLLALIGRDVPLKRVAATRGGEWAGPCPFCGGRDRLRVQPEQGLWWCRHCSEKWDDAIGYVRRQQPGLTFAQAVAELAGAPVTVADRPRPAVPLPADDEEPEPPAAWRAAGEGFVARCEAALWSPAGSRALAWLRGRGLRDETLRAWRVGFHEADDRVPPQTWGLAGARVWEPRGIVLPWYVEGQLWQLKVRRAVGEPKYLAIRGGHPVLYGADRLQGHPVLVLAEGEFDCQLLQQEAGDLVDVATLGACDKRPGVRALPYLLPYGRILLAFDADQPDRRGVRAGDQAAGRLAALSPRMRRLAVPSGKDATEYHQQDGQVRDWIDFALLGLDVEAGRLPAPEAESGPLLEACARCAAPVAHFSAAGEALCRRCWVRDVAFEGVSG